MQQAERDLERWREAEEKARRAREDKERRERERQEKAAKRKSAVLDVCTDEEQAGVMDNLLEALKSGSAFHVSRGAQAKRGRTPRAQKGALQKVRGRPDDDSLEEMLNRTPEETPARTLNFQGTSASSHRMNAAHSPGSQIHAANFPGQGIYAGNSPGQGIHGGNSPGLRVHAENAMDSQMHALSSLTSLGIGAQRSLRSLSPQSNVSLTTMSSQELRLRDANPPRHTTSGLQPFTGARAGDMAGSLDMRSQTSNQPPNGHLGTLSTLMHLQDSSSVMAYRSEAEQLLERLRLG